VPFDLQQLKGGARWMLGIFFMLAGANHFLNTAFYMGIMPPYLPWHLMLVYISGAAELLLGLGLLFRRTERLAAWGLIALVLAVTPANVHMALHPEFFPQFSPAGLWLRLALQVVLLGWVFWYTRKAAHAGGRSDD
jgi:uncharacterized membrane protein